MFEETLIVDHTKRKRIMEDKSLLLCPKCKKIGERKLSADKKYVQYLHKKDNKNRIESCIMKIHQEKYRK